MMLSNISSFVRCDITEFVSASSGAKTEYSRDFVELLEAVFQKF